VWEADRQAYALYKICYIWWSAVCSCNIFDMSTNRYCMRDARAHHRVELICYRTPTDMMCVKKR